MVNNRDIDKLIVQKVFEMSQAGNSHTEIGDFFHRSRRWAQNILHNYSKETFSPVSVKKRGPQHKTTQEEDRLIIQKAREKAHAPVRAVLGEFDVAQFDGVQLTAARLFNRRHDMIIRSWLRVDKTVLG